MARLLLGATILLVLVHEVLASRSAVSRRGATLLRRLVLVVLVGAAAFGGDVASIGRRLAAAMPSGGPKALPIPFDTRGDALLDRRLSAQVPANEFPLEGTREAIEAWRQATIDRLRELTDFSSAAAADVESVVVPASSSARSGAPCSRLPRPMGRASRPTCTNRSTERGARACSWCRGTAMEHDPRRASRVPTTSTRPHSPWPARGT